MNTICIKIGGSTVDTNGLLKELGKSLYSLPSDTFPVIIHGGGKDIANQLKLLNRDFSFVEGMRVTDEEMIRTVQMVLSGDVNKRIVNILQTEGVRAFGFSGVDASLFSATKMLINGQDIGFVGTISSVDTSIIDFFKNAGYIPVISPVSRDANGCIYNVNADLAASELAMALKADDLIFISDVPAVFINDTPVKTIHTDDIEKLIDQGHITGGMIPKLRSAAEAVYRGVTRVHICGWKDHTTLLHVLSGSDSSGTVISK